MSVQVIDKSGGRYKVVKTIGSSADSVVLEGLVEEAERYIRKQSGLIELDFTNYEVLYRQVLSSITAHRLVGAELVLGKIFDDIGFKQVRDSLFKDLVLYRLLFPKSKLKTTEYLYRYEQKQCTEDDIYRYMDKLHKSQKETIQKISYEHTLKILSGQVQMVFYDVTTLYFEIDRGDDLRKTGFSKEGRHQNPQIVLGLLVSQGGYPFAYEIFDGDKFEGHTMMPVLEAFKLKYKLSKLTVVADSGLLSAANIAELQVGGYDFILGARIKVEPQPIKDKILSLSIADGQHALIERAGTKLIVTYSSKRAKKDQRNRENGIKRLEGLLKTNKLTKANINKRGYNKFLEMEGEVSLKINQDKIEEDKKWDGLKGYLTNSPLQTEEVLENYQQLWQIERAFRVAKTDLRIRPIYHYKQRRIEAHICLNFVAYKVYKELERQLKVLNAGISPEKVIQIIQSIYEIRMVAPNSTEVKHLLILTEEQRLVQKLFNF